MRLYKCVAYRAPLALICIFLDVPNIYIIFDTFQCTERSIYKFMTRFIWLKFPRLISFESSVSLQLDVLNSFEDFTQTRSRYMIRGMGGNKDRQYKYYGQICTFYSDLQKSSQAPGLLSTLALVLVNTYSTIKPRYCQAPRSTYNNNLT